MAESPAITPEKLLCRFFAMASCRDGESCLFSHDKSITTTDNVCRFYLQGRCYYGRRCRFDHVKIKQTKQKHKKHESFKRHARPPLISNPTVLTAAAPTKSSSVDCPVVHPTIVTPNSERLLANDPVALNWANAPEFIPKCNQLSYAEKVKIGQEQIIENIVAPKRGVEICPYYEIGDCPFGDSCDEIHGNVCDICCKAALSPFDKDQQKQHKEMCLKEFVENMDLSFAVARSKDKTCGICFDTIMEKQPLSERRFGIMEKCNHIFCLTCIRKWRQVKPDLQYYENVLDTSVTRACPECRLPSDFIVPNTYWVDDEEEKKKLIDTYKTNLGKKHCKYFRKGEGNCPFGGACFYLHQYPDGKIATLPQPTPRRRQNQDGELDFVERIFLSDFFTSHDDPLLMNVTFSDLVYVLSDTDDDEEDEDSDESFSFFFDEQL